MIAIDAVFVSIAALIVFAIAGVIRMRKLEREVNDLRERIADVQCFIEEGCEFETVDSNEARGHGSVAGK